MLQIEALSRHQSRAPYYFISINSVAFSGAGKSIGQTAGSIIRYTALGLTGAELAYGAGKLIQKGNDRPSWNFGDVAIDSFGNALG